MCCETFCSASGLFQHCGEALTFDRTQTPGGNISLICEHILITISNVFILWIKANVLSGTWLREQLFLHNSSFQWYFCSLFSSRDNIFAFQSLHFLDFLQSLTNIFFFLGSQFVNLKQEINSYQLHYSRINFQICSSPGSYFIAVFANRSSLHTSLSLSKVHLITLWGG